MDCFVSPKYQMKLINEIDIAIWKEFKSYKEVRYYIDKWHEEDHNYNNDWENFCIKTKPTGEVDLLATLHGIDGDTLIKIAVDMGVETPDFIPSIALFRNEIKSDYATASATFEKAFKEIESHPDIAVGLANSALESIIKEIMQDENIKTKQVNGKTLYDLTSDLLKEFQLYPSAKIPIEIKTIGSSLLAVNQGIEKIRSEKTTAHGKTSEDYIIDDSLYTYFIVNSVVTVGLFLISFYKKKFPNVKTENEDINSLPF
jgi:hypothetical protein